MQPVEELVSEDRVTVGEEKREIDLLECMVTLTRYGRPIAIAVGTTAVLAVVITLLIPNRYTSTARILPPAQAQSTASMIFNQLAGGAAGSLASLAGKDLGIKSPNDLYIGMLKSDTVENAIADKFHLESVYDIERRSSVRKKLEDCTDIRSGKDGIISISVEDRDPQRATDIANQYVAELQSLSRRLAVTEASQRSLFLQEQLENAKNALVEAEVALKQTQQDTGVLDLESQAKAMLEAVASVRGQIVAKEVELRATQSFATEYNSTYVVLQRELAALRAQLAKLESQEQGGKGNTVIATAKLPTAGLEYVRRMREVKYREIIFGLLLQQYETAKMDEAGEGAVIQVLDVASLPDRKSSPKRTLLVLLATLGSALICGIVVFVREKTTSMKSDAKRLQQLLHLRAFFGRVLRVFVRRRT